MKKLCCFLLGLLLGWPGIIHAEGAERTFFFDDDNVLISIATFQDELYFLTYEGIFHYDAQAGESVLVTDEVTGDYRDAQYADGLCAAEHGLYAVQYAGQRVLRILDDAGKVKLQTVMQFEQDEDAMILQTAMTETHFCLLERKADDVFLRWIDRETRTERQQMLDGGFAMVSWGNNVVYAARSSRRGVTEYTVGLLETATGKTTDWMTSSVPVDSLCGRVEDRLYFISGDELCCWMAETGETEKIAVIPSGDVVAGTLAKDAVAVIVDNSLALRDVEGTTQKTTLTICQQGARSADYQTFLTDKPEVELRFVAPDGRRAEEQFVQDVLTRTSTTDIYQLTDVSTLYAIAEKQMAQDLSVSPALVQTVADMYPAFAGLFSTDGCIWAIPATCYLAVPGYNQEFFEQYGWPVPTTVMELLDLTEQWLNEAADDHPEAVFDPFSNGLTLEAILRQYEVERLLAGEDVTFENADLAEIVTKYQSLEARYRESAGVAQREITAFNIMDLPHSAQYQPLILSVQKDAQPAISNAYLEVAYYVINPYSAHVDEALDFLTSVCTSWDDTTRVLLLSSCDQAVESPGYQRERTALEERMAQAEQALQTCNAEDAERLQAEWENLQQALEILEENRWAVTAEEVACYQRMTGAMWFRTDDPLDELDDQLLPYYVQMQEGQISAEDFLRILNGKAAMVMLEK